MRRTVDGRMLVGVLVTALLCCTAANNVTAEEPPEKWLKYFEGGWSAEWATGDTTWYKNEFLADGHALFHVNPIDGGVMLMGWRPDTKTLVQTVYTAKGGFHQLELSELAEKSPRVASCGVLDNGTAYKGTGELRKIDNDNYEISQEIASTYWKFKGTNKYTRREKQPPANETSTATDTDTDATEERPYQKWLKSAQGDWKSEGAPGLATTLNVRLVADGHAFVATSPVGDVLVAGWRPDTKAFVWTQYSSNGGYIQDEYTDIGEDTLQGTTVGTLSPAAPALRGKVRMKQIDEDHFELTADLKMGEGKLTITRKFHRQKK